MHSGSVATSVATAVIPYLAPRSQGINGARELVGWQTQINKWDMCSIYGSFSITPEYTQNILGQSYYTKHCLVMH